MQFQKETIGMNFKTFRSEDERYMKLISMTRQDLNMAIDRLNDVYTRFDCLIGITRNHP